MPDAAAKIKTTLQRKLGPLPAWQWGVLVAGGIWAWRAFNPKRSSTVGQASGLSSAAGGIYPVASGGGVPPIDPGYGFDSGQQGALQGSVSLYGAGGGSSDVTGPFDFIERILPTIGGFISSPRPDPYLPQPGSVTVVQPIAQPQPSGMVEVRQPDPTPYKKQYTPLTPTSIRWLFADFPLAFKGNPEYWVNSLLGTGIPGQTAAQPYEWVDFWAAYARAGNP